MSKEKGKKTLFKRENLEQKMTVPKLEIRGLAKNAADKKEHQILLPGLRRCNDKEVAIAAHIYVA